MMNKENLSTKYKSIIVLSHFAALFILAVFLVSHMNTLFQPLSHSNYSILVIMLLMPLVIGFWYLDKAFIQGNKPITRYSYYFNIFLVILVAFIISLTSNEANSGSYCILMVLPVLTTVIAHGRKGGLLMAAISTAYLLSFHAPIAIATDSYLSTRLLIYISIFFATAILVGLIHQNNKDAIVSDHQNGVGVMTYGSGKAIYICTNQSHKPNSEGGFLPCPNYYYGRQFEVQYCPKCGQEGIPT